MRTLVHIVYINIAKLPKGKREPGTVCICGRFIPFDGWSIVKPSIIYRKDSDLIKRYFEALASSYRRKEQLIIPPFIIWRAK